VENDRFVTYNLYFLVISSVEWANQMPWVSILCFCENTRWMLHWLQLHLGHVLKDSHNVTQQHPVSTFHLRDTEPRIGDTKENKTNPYSKHEMLSCPNSKMCTVSAPCSGALEDTRQPQKPS
jgi:hypothetical protein